jgi:hypothetical protein
MFCPPPFHGKHQSMSCFCYMYVTLLYFSDTRELNMSEEAGDQSLDSVHVDTLLKARQRCGEKPATTVRIFERNDFYYFFEKVRIRTCRSPEDQCGWESGSGTMFWAVRIH